MDFIIVLLGASKMKSGIQHYSALADIMKFETTSLYENIYLNMILVKLERLYTVYVYFRVFVENHYDSLRNIVPKCCVKGK